MLCFSQDDKAIKLNETNLLLLISEVTTLSTLRSIVQSLFLKSLYTDKVHFGTAHHDNSWLRNCKLCDITGVRQSSMLKKETDYAESLLYKKSWL